MITEDLLAFSFINGIGEKTLKKLSYFENADEVIRTSDKDLFDVFSDKQILSEIKKNFAVYYKKALSVILKLNKNGAVLLTQKDKKYPCRLKTFDKSPFFLYCIGNTDLLNAPSTAAITGPRSASEQGLEKAYNTAKSLASEETVVVSGLAIGIDTEAHKAAVKHGKTIAVLPYFHPVYPAKNQFLCSEILNSGGLILSEHYNAFNVKFQLLNRDKLIVGLADEIYSPCIFRSDSGTAYTVNYALSQNKTTYINNKGVYVKLNK